MRLTPNTVRHAYRRDAWAFRAAVRPDTAKIKTWAVARVALLAMARGERPIPQGDTPADCAAWAILYRHAIEGRLPDWETAMRWREEYR
jgi:hypothetical protein